MAGSCWWGPEVLLYIEKEMARFFYVAEPPPPQGMLLGGFCKDQMITEKPSVFLNRAGFNYCFPHCWSNEVHVSSTLPPGLCSSPKCMTSVLSCWPEFAHWAPFHQPGGL